jgi:hypothetical protein
MKNLEAEQQKMREHNRGVKRGKQAADNGTSKKVEEGRELETLRMRVQILETENDELRIQVAVLQKQTRAQQPSYEAERRKQRHDFFKYSNARRYWGFNVGRSLRIFSDYARRCGATGAYLGYRLTRSGIL